MTSASPVAHSPKIMVWSGRILSTLIVAALLFSANFKLNKAPMAVDGLKKAGYPEDVLVPIGVTEVACAVLYAIPATSVLGAILVTGYLGGATATHVIQSQSVVIPIVIGMLAWLGLFLRDARIRALIPWKR